MWQLVHTFCTTSTLVETQPVFDNDNDMLSCPATQKKNNDQKIYWNIHYPSLSLTCQKCAEVHLNLFVLILLSFSMLLICAKCSSSYDWSTFGSVSPRREASSYWRSTVSIFFLGLSYKKILNIACQILTIIVEKLVWKIRVCVVNRTLTEKYYADRPYVKIITAILAAMMDLSILSQFSVV